MFKENIWEILATSIFMFFLIKFLIKIHKKWHKKIKGETIKIDDAIVATSSIAVGDHTPQLSLTVHYVINNREYTNKTFKKINLMDMDYFKKGKTITILVDKEDYNNIIIDSKWLYDIRSMYELDALIKKKENL